MIFILKKTISLADQPKSNTIFHYINDVAQSGKLNEDDFIGLADTGEQICIFDGVEDPRKRMGSVRYPIGKFLMMVLFAIVSEGCSCPLSIADHIWAHSEEYAQMGLLPDTSKAPSHDTVEFLLSTINPDDLNECLVGSARQFTDNVSSGMEEPNFDILQFDGKEITGTGRAKSTANPAKNTTMVNHYSFRTGLCLDSVPADSKSNEKPTVQLLLSKVDLNRRWITFDALHTSEINLEFIHHKKGWYLAPVKKNQKKTMEILKNMFSDPKMQRFIQDVEGHDRDFQVIKLTGKRQLEKFPSARLVLKMFSKAHSKDEPKEMYFITNSSSIEKAVYAAENRWAIETMHQVKDSVLIREDSIRIRNKTAQRNLAIINNFIAFVVRVIQSLDSKMTLARAKKLVRGFPEKCFKLVFGMISDEEFQELLKSGLSKEAVKKLPTRNLDVRAILHKE